MYPEKRMRRLRKKRSTRRLLKETKLDSSDLIYPIFVEKRKKRTEIENMPEIYRYPVEEAINLGKKIEELDIPAVILFGVPQEKDEIGSSAWDEKEAVQKTLRGLKKETNLTLMADTCLCGYTTHGHCGPVKKGSPQNDRTNSLLQKVALSQAEAGADFVCPSSMMDGMVGSIRKALDKKGFQDVAIMSYSSKYSSNFYGPFREAVESCFEGSRDRYQMSPSQVRESIQENFLDIKEGADILMVKPAMPYLDIIKETRETFDLPLAAYQVSGEFSILKNSIKNNILNKSVLKESLLGIKRSGADAIITYLAKELVENGEI